MLTEANTCRTYVLPKLQQAGWADAQIGEQLTYFKLDDEFTDGRIHVSGRLAMRGKRKRVDYLLFYRQEYPLAVVEAKAAYRTASEGVQQAKEYAQLPSVLDCEFRGEL
jgi:type I restriction enzyme, R subunit